MVKKDFQTNNTIFLKIIMGHNLDMYNGLSQVYCINPADRIHLYKKGYRMSLHIKNKTKVSGENWLNVILPIKVSIEGDSTLPLLLALVLILPLS